MPGNGLGNVGSCVPQLYHLRRLIAFPRRLILVDLPKPRGEARRAISECRIGMCRRGLHSILILHYPDLPSHSFFLFYLDNAAAGGIIPSVFDLGIWWKARRTTSGGRSPRGWPGAVRPLSRRSCGTAGRCLGAPARKCSSTRTAPLTAPSAAG